jgi:hypothetical protein
MTVCIAPGYLRADVARELLERFSNRLLAEGSKGFFHPDNFSFGDSLYLSRIVREAKQVAGVENVQVTRFGRRGETGRGSLEAGLIEFAPLEIARLDNDPLRPEFGCLCLSMRGER